MKRYCCGGVGVIFLLFAANAFAAPIQIENESLICRVAPIASQLRLMHKGSELELSLSFPSLKTAAIQEAEEGAQSIVVQSGDGATVFRIWLEAGTPFLQMEITSTRPMNPDAPDKNYSPECLLVLEKPEAMQLLGCDGLSTAAKDRDSYTFLAGAFAGEGETRQSGFVAGWPLQERGSGVVSSRYAEGALHVQGFAEFGRAQWAQEESAKQDRFVIGLFEDVLTGLESFADTTARLNAMALKRPIPSGYCTWYSNPHGGACHERHLVELAQFAAKELKPFGFDVVQIDDKWQAGRKRPKDFSGPRLGFQEVHPAGPYRRKGIEGVSQEIRELGLRPGLWFIPFAGDPENTPLKEHPEYFVQDKAGDPYYNYWAGWSLDMTQAGARKYLRDVASQITQDWGCSYIKVDGLWSGMATKILYPDPAYRPDNIGDAYFSDGKVSNIAAYRSGLRLLREASGKDTFILGCNIAQNMRTLGASFGLVDGMRVGRDIGAQWDHIIPCAELGSWLYFFHNRVWHNDPDCLMLREPLSLDQARAWASWIAVTGQMNLVSEWLPGLAPERLDLVKRSMPNHGLHARPVDLFRSSIPRIWRLNARGRTVIGVFNWDEKAAVEVSLRPQDLGGDAAAQYVGYAYWSQAAVETLPAQYTVNLAPSSCEVFSFIAKDQPGVSSTSRHITQGIIDLSDVVWDEAKKTLSATSALVGGDPCEVRLYSAGKEIEAITLSAADCEAGVALESDPAAASFRLVHAENRSVRWTATFK